MVLDRKTKRIFTIITVVTFMLMFSMTVFAAETETGKLVEDLWNNTIYMVIQEVGGTLAIATFVCSAFYFFVIGKSKAGTDLARNLMIGAGVGILIIYVGPIVVNAIIKAASNISHN